MKNIQFDNFGRMINNINIDIMEHGHFFGGSDWKFSNVNSPFSRLYFVIEGEAYIENQHHKVLLRPGNMYLIPSHSCYNFNCENKIEKFYLHLRTEVFSGYDVFEFLPLCISKPYDVANIDALIKKLEKGNPENIFFAKAFIYGIISKFVSEMSEELYTRLNAIYEYKDIFGFIKENCSASLTVNDILVHFNNSYSNLAKNFRKDVGKTLKKYIDHMVLQSSKEKLLLTNMSIKEIAYFLKFTDEFYFSRFFKKHTGLSPKKYKLENKLYL